MPLQNDHQQCGECTSNANGVVCNYVHRPNQFLDDEEFDATSDEGDELQSSSPMACRVNLNIRLSDSRLDVGLTEASEHIGQSVVVSAELLGRSMKECMEIGSAGIQSSVKEASIGVQNALVEIGKIVNTVCQYIAGMVLVGMVLNTLLACFSPAAASECSSARQMVMPSPFDSNGCADGQIRNGPSSGEKPIGQVTPWTVGYEIPLEDLKTRVRHQLEYYFSRENLVADAYLRSQMDNDQFVQVTVLANFNMVKRLTTDTNLILQALKVSPRLQLDPTEEKVRPVHKRCTLILREIPENTEKKASPFIGSVSVLRGALTGLDCTNGMIGGEGGTGGMSGCAAATAIVPNSVPITATVPPSTIYYYHQSQPTAIVSPGTVSAVMPATALISPTWAPGTASFDLGYILAMNGYQPQGAYRPALLLPAAPIPAHVAAAAAVGHRFVTDRPPRKPRTSGNYSSSRSTGRSLSSGTDNGGQLTAVNRYGTSSTIPRQTVTSGTTAAGEGKPSYYRNDQNIHYNNIRNGPSRQGSVNGNPVTNGVQPVRRYQPDYSSSSTNPIKDRRGPPSNSAVSTTNGNSSMDGKKGECFDLQASSFPPLPTASADDTDKPAGPLETGNNPTQSSSQVRGTDHTSNDECVKSVMPQSHGIEKHAANRIDDQSLPGESIGNCITNHCSPTDPSPPLPLFPPPTRLANDHQVENIM